MAGGANWVLKSAEDTSDIYTVDGEEGSANEGKRAWFLLRRLKYRIQIDHYGVYNPSSLGSEDGGLMFRRGDVIQTRILGGSSKFVCVSDRGEEKVNPTSYMLVTQEWEYLATTPKRISAWFDPDAEA